MRAILAALSFTIGACAHTVPDSALKVTEATAAFEDVVAVRAAEFAIPGIAYAVVRDGAVIAEGEITTEGGPEPTPDTRFASPPSQRLSRPSC